MELISFLSDRRVGFPSEEEFTIVKVDRFWADKTRQ